MTSIDDRIADAVLVGTDVRRVESYEPTLDVEKLKGLEALDLSANLKLIPRLQAVGVLQLPYENQNTFAEIAKSVSSMSSSELQS